MLLDISQGPRIDIGKKGRILLNLMERIENRRERSPPRVFPPQRTSPEKCATSSLAPSQLFFINNQRVEGLLEFIVLLSIYFSMSYSHLIPHYLLNILMHIIVQDLNGANQLEELGASFPTGLSGCGEALLSLRNRRVSTVCECLWFKNSVLCQLVFCYTVLSNKLLWQSSFMFNAIFIFWAILLTPQMHKGCLNLHELRLSSQDASRSGCDSPFEPDQGDACAESLHFPCFYRMIML